MHAVGNLGRNFPPAVRHGREIPLFQRRGDIFQAVLRVNALLRLRQNVVGDVRGMNGKGFYLGAEEKLFLQINRRGIRLVAGGAARAPDLQIGLKGVGGQNGGNRLPHHIIVMHLLPLEKGEVGGQLCHHLLLQLFVGNHRGHEFAEIRKPAFGNQPGKTALNQAALALHVEAVAVEHDAAYLIELPVVNFQKNSPPVAALRRRLSDSGQRRTRG